MRVRVTLLVVVLTLAAPLHAEMTDAAALRRARELWGPRGAIASIRLTNSTIQKKLVGVWTEGCAEDFTRLGQADSDFSLAFENYAARGSQTAGPFKGTVTLQAGATNDEAPVVEYQVFLDGRTFGEPIRFLPATKWEFTTVLNAQELTPGLHYLCARITNTLGHQQLSEAVLFRVDPNAATAAALWRLPILRFAGKVSLR